VNTTWERVTNLFGAARLLDAPARAAFLDTACAGDPELRTQIESLLEADAPEDGFLARPAFQVLGNGTVLNGRYVIDEPFGAGGHALVYRATDRVLGRPVVVKVLRAEPLLAVALKLRFTKEREALSRLDHPGVVGILDVGELGDGTPFLVIQFIDGLSLRDLLRDGPLEAARAARIIRGAAAALRAAHVSGIAHRDLKPENIMVQTLADGREVVKLIDFGIAKVERPDLHSNMTTVMIEGSVRYMAPEQFDGRNSAESDVYSLGLVACELLCGHPDTRALPKTTTARVRRLLEAAVSFDPAARPADVKQWGEALSAALRPRPRSNRLRLIGIAVATATVVAFLVFLAGREGPSDERIIEKIAGFDPVTEGFQIHNDVTGTVLRSPDNVGFVGWTVGTSSPGGGEYYKQLTAQQKRLALAKGWTLSATMRPVEGGAFAIVDLGRNGRRFDIDVIREGADDLIRLNTRIVPLAQGLELRLPHADNVFHTCELRYDPSLQSADLWVDGTQRLVGYRGHTEFQEDRGVAFGAAPYKSTRGVASFQHVHFEIRP
jgi:tRNA A-37 threonylcarbamoyl transferase component Bud32